MRPQLPPETQPETLSCLHLCHMEENNNNNHDHKEKKKHKKHKKHDHSEKHKERIHAEDPVDVPMEQVMLDVKPALELDPPAQPPPAEPKIRVFKSKNLLVAADAKRAVEISFSNVNYSVESKKGGKLCFGGKKETRNILTDITGAFRPGTLTAIMGASGAGKV